MSGMTGIEVDKGRDILPSAVFIDRISVVGRIQREFLNPKIRKVRFHRKKRMQERKHVMTGSPL